MKVYDFSYLTVDYINPLYLDVYHPEVLNHFPEITETHKSPPHLTFSIPSSIEFLRFTHIQIAFTSASFTCANTSLKYLDVSFGVYQNYPDFTDDCGKQLEYLDISGIPVTIITFPSIFMPKLSILKVTNARIDQVIIKRKVRHVVEKNLHENYMYDAYVSYEDRSVTWIQKFFLPKIEEKWGLKVCLHDRDLLPGDPTADAKAESIQQSRHVVFIITEHFTEGKWGRFEIERAKYEKYTTNFRKIIVILQNIQIKDIPDEIINISNDVYFIELPLDENEAGDNTDYQSQWLRLKALLYLN
ncbi:unnamed protein product [Mytilus edulis]|uniref:TIR domain-containing protein n=1 Tax=Mytilus edulis TaxID=6550 RepID=A0A8S3R029_MYTED|nr:unnamed protein product [Mytilus edulis]